jgi:methyl-accepting chemotaxis protein
LNTHLNQSHLNKLLKAMSAAGDGDFTVRLPVGPDDGILGKLAEKFNEVVERNEAMAREITRVEQAVRHEGLMTERATRVTSDANELS